MQTVYLNQAIAEHLQPCVATLGFFDGVHLGHKFLIRQVIGEAHVLGLPSMVITFDRHPRQVLHKDYQPELLTTLDAKLKLLEQTGVDVVVVLHFDETMASLSARDFMADILRNQLNVEKFVIGYDNRFGHNRSESFDDYVCYGHETGIEVVRSEAFVLDDIQVSSSVIRAFIKEGEITLANRCLGYPYTVVGRVVDGFKQGRKMGYPTANLNTADSGQLLPANGIYATQVRLGDESRLRPAMTNIGTRPTFGDNAPTLESHIFNFRQDIYGQTLHLSFVARIREERKYDNVTLLVEQIKEDEKNIEEFFKNHHHHE